MWSFGRCFERSASQQIAVPQGEFDLAIGRPFRAPFEPLESVSLDFPSFKTVSLLILALANGSVTFKSSRQAWT